MLGVLGGWGFGFIRALVMLGVLGGWGFGFIRAHPREAALEMNDERSAYSGRGGQLHGIG